MVGIHELTCCVGCSSVPGPIEACLVAMCCQTAPSRAQTDPRTAPHQDELQPDLIGDVIDPSSSESASAGVQAQLSRVPLIDQLVRMPLQ